MRDHPTISIRSLIQFILPASTVFGIVFILLVGQSSFAEEEPWNTERIDYPSTMMLDPDGSKAEKIMRDWKATTDAKKEKKAKWKKRLWPFGKDDENIPTEEEIVEVGPRIHAASKDAVFPLPKPLITSDGKILPGFYQVRELRDANGIKTLGLLQQNRPVMSIDVFLTTTRSGPAEKISGAENSPPKVIVSSEDSDDRQKLIIVYQIGDHTYKSDPLNVITDNRKVLP